mmetsp:Transcript_99545/g.149059  ORF Transcript_99545/g.149059 Transcript_99545/m.149059 type:complete len:154 (-) Transcript_99545:174-635(-)
MQVDLITCGAPRFTSGTFDGTRLHVGLATRLKSQTFDFPHILQNGNVTCLVANAFDVWWHILIITTLQSQHFGTMTRVLSFATYQRGDVGNLSSRAGFESPTDDLITIGDSKIFALIIPLTIREGILFDNVVYGDIDAFGVKDLALRFYYVFC